ncbi:hypothetical protein [Roseinatronobacter sp. S2]|uniref:hypothetical protein n=1 Tax=Roseinatronobacter sp. S2 TaxID=3035471 RepID=UPI00240EA25F|nr:hypothetical protein [Roseinatronobacter sp. S2]WFE76576.1 hypothetical protein P8S53_18835 [Roseinatronobacter sp. S2]
MQERPWAASVVSAKTGQGHVRRPNEGNICWLFLPAINSGHKCLHSQLYSGWLRQSGTNAASACLFLTRFTEMTMTKSEPDTSPKSTSASGQPRKPQRTDQPLKELNDDEDGSSDGPKQSEPADQKNEQADAEFLPRKK